MLMASAQMLAGQLMLEGDPGIVYWRTGDPTSGRVMIVLHGGPAMSTEYLRPEWDTLAALRQVIYYDQRGCGASGRASSYSWEDHVADLGRLIAYVSPDRPVVLAGSSWGAMLAHYYAARHPEDVQALVLSGVSVNRFRSGYDFLPDLKEPESPLYRSIEPPRFPSSLSGRTLNYARATTEKARVSALLEPRFVADCPEVRVETFQSLSTAPQQQFDDNPVPTLIFPDNHFGFGFAQAAAAPIVEGYATTIIGGGHDPWFEYPDSFFDAVRDFLQDVWR
jgi:pimeloyl-ACP methyl ester carboxylesterase